MAKGGAWGGNLELVAASRLFNVHVTVHQLDAPRLDIINHDNPRANTIHVAYHDERHYTSVRKISDNSFAAAKVEVRSRNVGLDVCGAMFGCGIDLA